MEMELRLNTFNGRPARRERGETRGERERDGVSREKNNFKLPVEPGSRKKALQASGIFFITTKEEEEAETPPLLASLCPPDTPASLKPCALATSSHHRGKV